jgi:hypothetical protein
MEGRTDWDGIAGLARRCAFSLTVGLTIGLVGASAGSGIAFASISIELVEALAGSYSQGKSKCR